MVPQACKPEVFDAALKRVHETGYPPTWPFPADELDMWRAAFESAIGVINETPMREGLKLRLRDHLCELRDAGRP